MWRIVVNRSQVTITTTLDSAVEILAIKLNNHNAAVEIAVQAFRQKGVTIKETYHDDTIEIRYTE